VRINDEKGADLWGEYRIPDGGNILPLKVRVLNGNNDYACHFNIHHVDHDRYLSLGSLSRGSVLELSYLVEDVFDRERYGSLVELRASPLQDYNEPVTRFRARVIAPAGAALSFQIPEGVSLDRHDDGENTLYSLEARDLQALHREAHSGNDLNSLPWYAFATAMDEGDIRSWHRGLLAEHAHGAMDLPEAAAMSGAPEARAALVYTHVVKEVKLIHAGPFHPSPAEDTLFNRRGTAEDRALLAQEILARQGVSSYLALARSRFMPPTSVISPGAFTDVLLHVPLDEGRGLWLDFSSDYYSCGMVKASLEGVNALVLLATGWEYRKVRGRGFHERKAVWNIDMERNGDVSIAVDETLSGRYGSLAHYFRDTERHEATMYALHQEQLPNLEIDRFTIALPSHQGGPLCISFSGRESGFALSGTKTMRFRPLVRGSSVLSYLKYTDRRSPLVIDEPISESEIYTCILPPAFYHCEIEEHFIVESPFGRAKLSLSKKKGRARLDVLKNITLEAAIIKPQDYHEFLRFCLDLSRYESYTVVLEEY
jgi:hypothetical protein